ncbi:MAG TPA: rhodanese-like domain-containing protein, partial [Candidatus Dormibacteraeota bacterium]|nr:rhodanese-like domain-containing protein [Candidatus Dormibacteraeota bacterium]
MSESNGNFANPQALVSTQWAADHRTDAGVQLVEVDVDTTSYEIGHIEGAAGWNWRRDLQDQTLRDVATRDALAALLGKSGITPQTTIVLYGDNNNWFAAYAYWLLKYYGHEQVRLIDGGRVRWEVDGRPYTADVPTLTPTSYQFLNQTNESIRAYRDQINQQLGTIGLVDVRSPKEFAGELVAPENLPQEGAQRGGHIPSAVNVPWATAVREDGTFKSAADLEQLYG